MQKSSGSNNGRRSGASISHLAPVSSSYGTQAVSPESFASKVAAEEFEELSDGVLDCYE